MTDARDRLEGYAPVHIVVRTVPQSPPCPNEL